MYKKLGKIIILGINQYYVTKRREDAVVYVEKFQSHDEIKYRIMFK